ncbi:hypothetical protein VTJ83DRAFT_6555 [Remersonia thermophila]|uniref:Uncharacterized protein n=1 Tax=Remersonia thermophila TaxID=72144 RepID=A0ABR4D5X6_9PEZI
MSTTGAAPGLSKAFYAIIAGVGGGTGRAVALRFARTYPVALLARGEASYADVVAEITRNGGEAVGVRADVSDEKSLAAALEVVKGKFQGKGLAVGVFNVSSPVSIKPFLETKLKDLDQSLAANARGLYNFAHATLPSLVESVSANPPYPPTLLVTGATAALRGSAGFGVFAAGKFAVRALSQSLAREFGPQGVHVAHVVVDGVIEGPRTKGYIVEGVEDGKLNPAAIAESYWHLHTQHRSAFTHELDLRPYAEKF